MGTWDSRVEIDYLGPLEICRVPRTAHLWRGSMWGETSHLASIVIETDDDCHVSRGDPCEDRFVRGTEDRSTIKINRMPRT